MSVFCGVTTSTAASGDTGWNGGCNVSARCLEGGVCAIEGDAPARLLPKMITSFPNQSAILVADETMSRQL